MTTKPVRCTAPDCGRILRSPKSVALGVGPRCKAKLNAARAVMEDALAGLSDAQKTRALALIGDRKVRPTSQRGQYAVTGSDDVTIYLTTVASCGCRAFACGRTCYHVGAVRCVAAARASLTRRAA
jgi:hypothetical protein